MAAKGKKDKAKGKGKKARQKDTTGKAEKLGAKLLEPAREDLLPVAGDAVPMTGTKRKTASADSRGTRTKPGPTAHTTSRNSGRASTPGRAGSLDLAILDAALAEAASNGLAALTTRRIAEVAAVNEVTIFRRFGSKQALLQALFAREAQHIRDAGGQYTGDVEADLLRIASVFADTSQPARTSVILSALGRNDEMRALAEEMTLALGELAAVLARYMDDGVLQQDIPASALGALIGPLLLQPALDGAESTTDASALVQAFLHGRARGARQQAFSSNKEFEA